jgi:hypothetical protein
MLTGTNATPGIQSNLIMQTSYQKQNQQQPMMNKMIGGDTSQGAKMGGPQINGLNPNNGLMAQQSTILNGNSLIH